MPFVCDPCYRDRLFVGVVMAAGGLTESLVRHAGQSLLAFFGSLPAALPNSPHALGLSDTTDMLLRVFETNKRQTRVVTPLLDVLDQLLAADMFQELPKERLVYSRCVTECCRSICNHLVRLPINCLPS